MRAADAEGKPAFRGSLNGERLLRECQRVMSVYGDHGRAELDTVSLLPCDGNGSQSVAFEDLRHPEAVQTFGLDTHGPPDLIVGAGPGAEGAYENAYAHAHLVPGRTLAGRRKSPSTIPLTPFLVRKGKKIISEGHPQQLSCMSSA